MNIFKRVIYLLLFIIQSTYSFGLDGLGLYPCPSRIMIRQNAIFVEAHKSTTWTLLSANFIYSNKEWNIVYAPPIKDLTLPPEVILQQGQAFFDNNITLTYKIPIVGPYGTGCVYEGPFGPTHHDYYVIATSPPSPEYKFST